VSPWSSSDILESRLQIRLTWVAVLAVLSLQIAGFHGLRNDDAYITYRYGQNLATGHGLVFNPGQRVQGSTSPGAMLLSALAYFFFGVASTPTAMAVVGCLGWTLQAIAVYRLLSAALGRASAAAIALAVALGAAGAASFVPLETHLVAAAMLYAFALAREGRWIGAAIAAGVAALLRPDAWLGGMLVLGVCVWQLRSRALRPAAVFFAIALAWPLFATFYYGAALPQSAVAKFHQSPFLQYLLHELSLPGESLLRSATADGWTWLILALAVAGAIRLVRRDPALGLWVAYGTLHAAAYLVLLPPGMHTWHLYPWSLLATVCALAALVPVREAKSSVVARIRMVAITGSLAMIAWGFVRDWRSHESSYWSGQRDLVYRRIASFLRTDAPAGAWYASIEVGTISFFSQLPAYDLGGLVTRASDPISAHPVRYIVVDRLYRRSETPSPPVFSAREGEFEAYVYAVKPGG
jgi:hypothetical protein